MKSISTDELIKLIKENKKTIYEVSINNRGLRATHFIYFGGKLIYDTGIDSQEVKWNPMEFLFNYKVTFWKIDQVIPKL